MRTSKKLPAKPLGQPPKRTEPGPPLRAWFCRQGGSTHAPRQVHRLDVGHLRLPAAQFAPRLSRPSGPRRRPVARTSRRPTNRSCKPRPNGRFGESPKPTEAIRHGRSQAPAGQRLRRRRRASLGRNGYGQCAKTHLAADGASFACSEMATAMVRRDLQAQTKGRHVTILPSSRTRLAGPELWLRPWTTSGSGLPSEQWMQL